jgi:transcriptional regulator GlxA family with amidase domain
VPAFDPPRPLIRCGSRRPPVGHFLEREGGQAQFTVHDQPSTPRGCVLEPVLRWKQDNADQDLTLQDIAAECGRVRHVDRFRD